MKKLYIPILLFAGLSLSLTAQEKSRKELQGDKYAFRYSFDKAIDSYSHAKQLTTEGQRRLAESYHNMGQNTEAEAVYAKLISSQNGVLPEDYYNYAMILKGNGKYDEANKTMDKFADLKPDDLRAKSYTDTKAEFPNLLKDDGKSKILHLDFNTAAQDFGTCFYKDKVVFSSTRAVVKMIKRSYNWNGKPFLNMYVSAVDGTQLKKPEIFDKSLDGKMHDGPAAFNADGTYMAYTRNHLKDKSKDKIVELQICFSNLKDGKWSEPELFTYNSSDYSVGQPFLTSDGRTMYFTSDMPGGFGGSDLYRTTKDASNAWSKPENLGNKVNTEGDEMFSFLEENKMTLFFSSNGRSGLGGFDIFSSPVNGKDFGLACNAGTPLNSQYDDFACIIDEKTNKGYFSSNRSGGSGDDDIYSVELLKVAETGKKIQGFAMDKNQKVLPGTFVSLSDDKNKVIDTATTKGDGAYSFAVASDKNYRLTGTKQKYIEGDSSTNTFGKELIVKADVILLTKEQVVASKIEVGKDLAKILNFESIFFDYGKYNIRPDAIEELDKIVAIMNDYPKMTVEFRSHTDCRSTKHFNQILSDERAKASADYIKKRISNPSRIYGKGYGEEKLANVCPCEGDVVSDCTEDEHQKNRRTEFIIIKK